MSCSGVYLTNFKVFGDVVKNCLSCLMYFLSGDYCCAQVSDHEIRYRNTIRVLISFVLTWWIINESEKLVWQIQRLVEELKVRYYAEEHWTGLKTSPDQLEALLLQECWSDSQLTSNPWRVRRLLTKLKELRVQAQYLEKNSAFRPAISQVKSTIEALHVLRSACWRIVEELSEELC